MKDIELLEECRVNPDQGLGYVIDQYAGFIYAIIYNKISSVGNQEDARECVSDVFVNFYSRLNEVDLSKGSIKTYLAVIAKRKGIDLYRTLVRRNSQTIADDTALEEYKDDRIDLEGSVIKKEEKKQLLDALDSLGEPDREIFIRKYYLGQKTKEIAVELGLNDNTVDKKISRGLVKLRNRLGGVTYGEKNNLYAK